MRDILDFAAKNPDAAFMIGLGVLVFWVIGWMGLVKVIRAWRQRA